MSVHYIISDIKWKLLHEMTLKIKISSKWVEQNILKRNFNS